MHRSKQRWRWGPGGLCMPDAVKCGATAAGQLFSAAPAPPRALAMPVAGTLAPALHTYAVGDACEKLWVRAVTCDCLTRASVPLHR